jgi:hypothetical protein
VSLHIWMVLAMDCSLSGRMKEVTLPPIIGNCPLLGLPVRCPAVREDTGRAVQLSKSPSPACFGPNLLMVLCLAAW